ncbi:MAG: M24 family metallopeptidase, partial [Defluviitaleaceae bacterium]|nr:M24 family metallopeptidase [Defluviitaleaceae bacterium]
CGFTVVQEWCGHGIGRQVHEDPQIPNHKMATRGPMLKRGMTLAVEPMVNEGGAEVETLENGWTIVTLDKKYSAHYENTVLITDGEPEIMTV